jgi:hypothetical protein
MCGPLFKTPWERAKLGMTSCYNYKLLERDKSYQRKVFIKSCYVMLNNKKFCRQINYRKVVTAMVLKFDCPSVPPKHVRDLFHKVRRLTPQGIARQRWSVIRSSVKLLSLHSRAVITANHPLRKLERGEFDTNIED